MTEPAAPLVSLKKGREKTASHGHPWIFSGAVASVSGGPAPGDVVRVADAAGAFVGWGHYSPASQIRVRLLSWNEAAYPDEAWWRERLAAAVERRRGLLDDPGTDACRLVHAEADLLPGLIVDRYAGFLVLQALTAGADRLKQVLVAGLQELLGPQGIYERSDAEVRKLEGLPLTGGLLAGAAPPRHVTIRENGLLFLVDVREGQKTGFFLDQRINRRAAAAQAAGREVLDGFGYTGAFSVYAAKAGAKSVTLVESSPVALEIARENLSLNGIDPGAVSLEAGDAFTVLRSYRDAARSFDMVILDPPRLAPTRAHAARASRAYKDINLLAMKLLRPGGILVTFSCSGGVDRALFREILCWAGLDAGREVEIIGHLSQGPDHPVRLSFPESEYLKGYVCLVL